MRVVRLLLPWSLESFKLKTMANTGYKLTEATLDDFLDEKSNEAGYVKALQTYNLGMDYVQQAKASQFKQPKLLVKASEHLNQAIRLNPTNPKFQSSLGYLFILNGDNKV